MIWLNEIDKALVTLIEKEIGVVAIPRYPDKKLLEANYPCISFYNYNMTRHVIENKCNKVITNIDRKKGVASVTKTKDRQYLHYQIDLWAKKTKDINNLLEKFYKIFPMNVGSILCLNSDGIEEEIFISKTDYRNLDTMEDNTRIFRRCLSYKIEGYINYDEKEVQLNKGIKIKLSGGDTLD